MNSDENLPDVPEENFTRERERTVDSYSESISLDDEPSDERPITADNDSSKAEVFEDAMVGWELDSKGIEATLHQIATGLKNCSDGYLALASHIAHVDSYALLQIIAQIPQPPMNKPIPIRKALLVDGESKTVSYLIDGEYKLTIHPDPSCKKKYHISRDKVYTGVKGKKRPGGSQYQQKNKKKKQTKAMSDITKGEAAETLTAVQQKPLD